MPLAPAGADVAHAGRGWARVLGLTVMNPDADAPQTPDVVAAVPVENAAGSDAAVTPDGEAITEPAKLLRIASMVRELLGETRQASLDEAGRKRLADIYHRPSGGCPRCSRPI